MKKLFIFFLLLCSPVAANAVDYTAYANCMGSWEMEDSGNETDTSGEGGTLTETSGTIPQVLDSKVGTYARDFEDGETEWLAHADGNSTDISGADQSLSVVFWYRRESDVGTWQSIISKYATTTANRQYQLNWDEGSGGFGFTISSDGTAWTKAVGATIPALGVWTHVAGVYNDTDMRIYVNGVLDSNGADNPKSYTAGIYNGNQEFRIGARPDASENADGYIDDVAVFNKALSAAEVADIYANGLDGSGSHAVAAPAAMAITVTVNAPVVVVEEPYLRPDGDTTTNWDASCTGDYTCVDEQVTQPTAGDGSDRKADKNDDSAVDQFTMTTKTLSGTCTQIVIWLYGRVEDTNLDPTVDIYDGSSWEGAKTTTFTTSDTWTSYTWSGLTWNQTQLDALQVKMTASAGIGSSDEHYIDTIYADITDTPAAGTRRVIGVH